MKKYTKLTTAAMLGAMIVGAASGCGKTDLVMWTGFGAAYTKAVQSMVDTYASETGLSIDHQSQGAYDKLQTNMNNSVATASYPNIANGYPDHFAGYIKSSIQIELDDFIKEYDEEHGTNLLDDYYPQYMVENTSLMYDSNGKGYVMGLPFNKSTEVMGYNAQFMTYCKSVDNTITKVPETWDEWLVVGPKMLKVMEGLYGKKLFAKGEVGSDNLTDFEIVDASIEEVAGKVLIMDCSRVTKEKFRLLCWDSADNMFITIVRQWGGVYTSYTAEDAKKDQHGYAEFGSGENRAKTKAAMQYFKDAFDAGIFGLPSNVSDDSYSSTAFKNYQCMFTICSSGGLSYNISDTMRFKIAAIPYKDAAHKYVISQGTNLALFDQGDDETKKKAFDAIVAFTTGELQGKFAYDTGYYPSSKSATQSAAYQSLITGDTEDLAPTKRAYKESAILNENVYMADGSGWTKFVDPGFVGSSTIRSEVKSIMSIVLAGEKSLDTILDETLSRISKYVR